MWSDYFYPRSPCGERPINKLYDHLRDKISIHALLAESDGIQSGAQQATAISIHALLAESDKCRQLGIGYCSISIHALLAESDAGNWFCVVWSNDFYPRSPCGERPLSCRQRWVNECISIHALLAESDRLTLWAHRLKPYFYPRSPCGERLF